MQFALVYFMYSRTGRIREPDRFFFGLFIYFCYVCVFVYLCVNADWITGPTLLSFYVNELN
jgi:hypothetical protein